MLVFLAVPARSQPQQSACFQLRTPHDWQKNPGMGIPPSAPPLPRERPAFRVLGVFYYGLSLLMHELEQIVGSAYTLAGSAAPLPAPERLRTRPSPGRRSTLPVSVGNAEVDVLEELAHLLRVLAEDSGGQPELGLVGLLKRFVKGLEFVDGDERHEQFLLHQPMIRRKTSHNCRCDIVPFGQLSLRSFSTRQNLAAVFFGLLDRSLILLERLIINHWTHEGRFLSGISNDDLVNLRLENLQKVFSDAPLHIDPRRRAALLTPIAVGSLHNALGSLVQVRLRRYDSRVLASHLRNERLRIRLLGDKIPVELHSNILRTSKRNPSNQRVARKFSSEGTAGTRDVVNDAGRDSGLDKNLVQL